MSERPGEMRCFCSRHPLLARYGRDEHGELYIHIKVFKQSRVFAEITIGASAKVEIRCRECLRLHKVKIIQGSPRLEPVEIGTSRTPDNPGDDVLRNPSPLQ